MTTVERLLAKKENACMLWIERPQQYDNYTATTKHDQNYRTAFHAFFWLVDPGTMRLSFITNYCFAGIKFNSTLQNKAL